MRAKRASARAAQLGPEESPIKGAEPEPYASPDARAELQEEGVGGGGGFTGDESWLN